MKRIFKWTKERIEKSWLIKKGYSGLWYTEIGTGLYGRIGGKGPELMSYIYLMEKIFDLAINGFSIVKFIILIIVTCFATGYIYKHIGLFKEDREVQTLKDPINTVMYEAAMIIKSQHPSLVIDSGKVIDTKTGVEYEGMK